MFQDLSWRLKHVFGGFETRLKFIKLGLWSDVWKPAVWTIRCLRVLPAYYYNKNLLNIHLKILPREQHCTQLEIVFLRNKLL